MHGHLHALRTIALSTHTLLGSKTTNTCPQIKPWYNNTRNGVRTVRPCPHHFVARLLQCVDVVVERAAVVVDEKRRNQ